MIDALQELRVVFKQSHKTMQNIITETGLSKQTVYSVLSDKETVVRDNQNLYTVITIAEALGAEVHVSTPESRAAIDQSDVTYYREMMAKLYAQIEKQQATIAAQQESIEKQRSTIAKLTDVMYKVLNPEG